MPPLLTSLFFILLAFVAIIIAKVVLSNLSEPSNKKGMQSDGKGGVSGSKSFTKKTKDGA